MAKVACIGMIFVDHVRLGWREYGVRSNHVLHSFIDVRHMTVHASVTTTCRCMVCVLQAQLWLLERTMALQAGTVVLFGCSRPLLARRLVRVMAMNASQFGIAFTFQRIAVLR